MRTALEEEVLKRIRPTREQLLLLGKLYAGIKNRLETCLSSRGFKVIVEAEGSYAKGTLLSDKWEIDIFAIFPEASVDWINRESLQHIKTCLGSSYPFYMKYAQHPYLTVSLMGMEADIVPVTGNPRMGVERTPLHTRWVLSRFDDRLRDEARLLKSFLKGLGIYGAETRTRGFSGYAAELLVYAYGGFRSVLEAARGWRPGTIIDPEGGNRGENLRRKYRDSVIIIVDPVDPERNAAASVSMKSLAVFVAASKLYLKRPSPYFFHVYKCRPARPPKPRSLCLLWLSCNGTFTSKPPETVWGRLYRSARNLARLLSDEGFTVYNVTVEYDESSTADILLLLGECRRGSLETLKGPPAWSRDERIVGFVEKRLRENSIAYFTEEGVLVGLRYREPLSAVEVALSWIGGPGDHITGPFSARCTPRLYRCWEEWIPQCDPTPCWMRSP